MLVLYPSGHTRNKWPGPCHGTRLKQLESSLGIYWDGLWSLQNSLRPASPLSPQRTDTVTDHWQFHFRAAHASDQAQGTGCNLVMTRVICLCGGALRYVLQTHYTAQGH